MVFLLHAGCHGPLRMSLRYAHQVCGGGRVYAATAILDFMRCTTRAVFAPGDAHLYLPPRASKVTPRGHCYAAAACHAFCGDGARPMCSLRSKVALRQAQGFVVAAAKLRPTVAVMGSSNVVGEGTAAARQRQAARGRA